MFDLPVCYLCGLLCSAYRLLHDSALPYQQARICHVSPLLTPVSFTYVPEGETPFFVGAIDQQHFQLLFFLIVKFSVVLIATVPTIDQPQSM